jgi:hypothetical protein
MRRAKSSVLATISSGLVVSSNLFVVLLKGSNVLTSLGELTLLHTFTDIPVDECTLGVHEVELVVDSVEHRGDTGVVADVGDCAGNRGHVRALWEDGLLPVNALLETSGVPADELNGALGLDGGNSSIHVLDNNVTAEQQAHRHVSVVGCAGVALHHEVGRLKCSRGDLSSGVLLVTRLSRAEHWGIRLHHEVDAGIRDQVDLELVKVNVEVTAESQRSGQGRHDLGNQAVEVGVGGGGQVKVSLADIIDGLIVKDKVDISVLQESMGGEHSIVGLNNGSGHHGGGVDRESKLWLLGVVSRQALQEQRSMARASSSTNSVVNEAEKSEERREKLRKLGSVHIQSREIDLSEVEKNRSQKKEQKSG